jgi:anti-anti-sigma factor
VGDVYFDLDINREENILIVTIKGRLVFPEAEKAEGTIIHAISEHNVNVLFNFSNCDFIASSGYAIFIRIKKECDEKGLKIAFSNCIENVRRGFYVIGYQKIVNFFDDKNEGIAFLKG